MPSFQIVKTQRARARELLVLLDAVVADDAKAAPKTATKPKLKVLDPTVAVDGVTTLQGCTDAIRARLVAMLAKV